MEQIERVLKLHNLLAQARYPIARRTLQEKLECSEKTIRRDLDFLRDRLGAPLEYDQDNNGWFYHHDQASLFELPWLWLNEEEIHALLSMQQLMSSLDPGFLREEIAPFEKRIRELLKQRYGDRPDHDISQVIQLVSSGQRQRQYRHFQAVASATLQRKRLFIEYFGRGKNEISQREVSPLRLLHYKENWYLNAWCHLRDGLRMFSLDKIGKLQVTDQLAAAVDSEHIDAAIHSSFGIFTGDADKQAVLRFNAIAARWVADEAWHPEQQGRFLDDGCYELTIPYNNPAELAFEILRFGDEVEVLAPPELRELIRRRLTSSLAQYQ